MNKISYLVDKGVNLDAERDEEPVYDKKGKRKEKEK